MTSKILKPASEAEAAKMIADARAAGTSIELIGNGSKRAVGNKIQADQVISAAEISGITQYDAAELVMVAKAGTTMSEIDKALAKNKQTNACV